jgi:putative transposase
VPSVRVARLMRRARLQGVPQRRRKKLTGGSGARCSESSGVELHRSRSQYQWVTDITDIRTAEHRLYLSPPLDLYADLVSGPRVDCANRADGVMAAIRPHPGHSGFGSGLSVYLRGVPAVAGGTSHNLQHERSG